MTKEKTNDVKALFSMEGRELDDRTLLEENRAAFPALPAPFNHMYAKVRNLNTEIGPAGNIEDTRPVPAVEIGFKWTF